MSRLSLPYQTQMELEIDKARIYDNIGMYLYISKGNNPLPYFEKSKNISQSLSYNDDHLMLTNELIMITHLANKDTEKSRQYYEIINRSQHEYMDRSDWGRAATYGNLAIHDALSGNYKQALEYISNYADLVKKHGIRGIMYSHSHAILMEMLYEVAQAPNKWLQGDQTINFQSIEDSINIYTQLKSISESLHQQLEKLRLCLLDDAALVA